MEVARLGKRLPESKAITRQDSKQLQPQDLTPEQQKADLITAYVEKFAAIAGRAVTPQMYAVYVEALEDCQTRRIEKGLKRYLQEGTNWPWPGTLREYIEEEV